jgi:D-3-phosphoglycerate dehydrogenase / 2-oxoglutarate reductase
MVSDRRVLVTDPIAQDGIDALARSAAVDVKLRISPDELLRVIGEYDALVVRSETKVTAPVIEAGKKLIVIGRAGAGVDNIDLEAATRRGVIVVNAPLGNTTSAAEHTIALMLSLSRYIPQANAILKGGKWERQRFMGVEVRGKTLGVLGLGQIGSEVARRARGLDMHVIACDPFVSEERAQSLIVEMVSLEDLLRRADYIAVHTALTPQTRGLIGEKELRLVKPSARIINVARGGIVDEEALYLAVEEGRVAGAAVDVFSKEPAEDSILFKSDRIIVTPHLGASTAEAQERVALDVAEQIAAIFRGEPPAYSVNAPLVPPETMAVIGPYVEVAVKTASLATQLSLGQLNSVDVEYLGDIAGHDLTPLKAAVIKGLLEPVSEENVTIVNANLVAEHRGLRISEKKGSYEGIFTNLIQVRATTKEGTTTVSGTMGHDGAHIVQINEFWVDVSPGAGYLLICENIDRPGMIGTVGTILGKHSININSMRVAPAGGRAMMVLGLDSAATDDVVEEMATVTDIFSVRRAKI